MEGYIDFGGIFERNVKRSARSLQDLYPQLDETWSQLSLCDGKARVATPPRSRTFNSLAKSIFLLKNLSALSRPVGLRPYVWAPTQTHPLRRSSLPRNTRAHKKENRLSAIFFFVSTGGLEPPIREELVPKTSVYTIPPLARARKQ